MDDHSWNAALQEALETIDAKIGAATQAAERDALRQLREDILILLRPQI